MGWLSAIQIQIRPHNSLVFFSMTKLFHSPASLFVLFFFPNPHPIACFFPLSPSLSHKTKREARIVVSAIDSEAKALPSRNRTPTWSNYNVVSKRKKWTVRAVRKGTRAGPRSMGFPAPLASLSRLLLPLIFCVFTAHFGCSLSGSITRGYCFCLIRVN